MPSKTKSFFLNAISLALTAFAMRGVGMIFNIYVSGQAGSEVMGLYSLLGSVYGFAVTLGCAGINLGTTRLVSDALGLSHIGLAKRSIKRALLVCTVSGGGATLLLFFAAPLIAGLLLADPRATAPLQVMALTLLPVAVCSCLSGYFTAVRRVKLNAAFQLPVQVVKFAVTVLLLSAALNKGTESACMALVAGNAIAELLSLLLTLLLYRLDLKKLGKSAKEAADASRGITKKLLSITLPVTFSACVRSALSMVQHSLIPAGLRASGQSHSAALSSYGALHGMAMPVILFPSALSSAFSGLLIPEVSEYCVRGEHERLKRVSYRALTLALFFSVGISGIMLFFSRELGILLYHNEETALYIRVMAPLIPVMYIDSTVDAILKGAGHQVYSMNVNIADALTACLFALTLIPAFGIWGYVISIYATELLNTTLSLYKMLSVTGMRPHILRQVLLPVLSVSGAAQASKLLLTRLSFQATPLSLTAAVLFTVGLYIAALALTGALGQEEKALLAAWLIPERVKNSQKNKQPAD